MNKLNDLYKEYLQAVDSKFTDKKSPYYLSSGFSEWLGDRYKEDWTKLAQECGFPTNAELRRKIHLLITT